MILADTAKKNKLSEMIKNIEYFFQTMPFLCEICQCEMEPIKQKYICKNCHHIKPCCEGEICNE